MKTATVTCALCVLLAGVLFVGAADTLPDTLDDASFWRFVTNFSEADGQFRYENLLSNEISYQMVMPALMRATQPTGAYIGVGPEQNFTYIAGIEPKIAFIVDIRRQNMLELLMYKALFETSSDRAEFVSKLFSRSRPAGLETNATASQLFKAYESETCDQALLAQTIQTVDNRLIRDHGFRFDDEDVKAINHVLHAFCKGGPQIDYGFTKTPNLTAPSYSELMTATDGRGENWSYLANEVNFNRIRDMQRKNLIVPLTGDFAGMTALRAVGSYLKRHNAAVTAFYLSNVEQYLNSDQTARFRLNVALLPVTSSTMLIRFIPPESTVLQRARDFLLKNGKLFHLLDSSK
jgi:hypothetical protein